MGLPRLLHLLHILLEVVRGPERNLALEVLEAMHLMSLAVLPASEALAALADERLGLDCLLDPGLHLKIRVKTHGGTYLF